MAPGGGATGFPARQTGPEPVPRLGRLPAAVTAFITAASACGLPDEKLSGRLVPGTGAG